MNKEKRETLIESHCDIVELGRGVGIEIPPLVEALESVIESEGENAVAPSAGIGRHRFFSFSKISEALHRKEADSDERNDNQNEKEAKRAAAETEFEEHDIIEMASERSDWLWFSVPKVPVAGAHCAIYFNKGVSEALGSRPQVQIIRAFNEWELEKETMTLQPSEAAKEGGSDWWTCHFLVPEESYEMNFVFTDGEGAFDNNYGQDFLSPVHWGTTKDEWLDGANARAAAEMDRLMAEAKEAAEDAERVHTKQLEQQDVEKAKWKIGEIQASYSDWQQGATDAFERDDGVVVWKMQKPATAGKTATLFYNVKSSVLAHLDIPPNETVVLKIGQNGWQTPRDIEMKKAVGEPDVWSADFDVPIDAAALNFVFCYGDAFDNNNQMDYRAIVHPPVSAGTWDVWLQNLIPSMTEIERAKRLKEEKAIKEKELRRERMRQAAMDRALAVGRRQIKHVLFTDPPVLEAGSTVTIYYCPNDTCLNGKEQVYMMGGWNRWAHKSKLGPIEMKPPGKEGVHWRATVKIPVDVFMMDFVFSDVEEGDGTYDNRGGFDYHIPISGSLAKEAPLHIVHISVEMAPIAKVGGLGDVVTSLGRAVKEQGHLVEVILPRFDFFNNSPMLNQLQYDCEYEWAGTHIYVTTQIVEGLRVFFIEPKNGMFSVDSVYGRSDDSARFDFFCRAALQFLLMSGRQPDILHCHDWPTAPIAKAYWEEYHHWGLWKPRCVFTIHNLNYGQLQIGEAAQYSQRFTTVSPTYAFEVGSHQAIGPNVGKFMGIRNGIDMEIWDPENDPYLPKGFDATTVVDGKEAARWALAERIGIDAGREAPIVSVISRLTAQKGVDLIKHAAWRVLERGGIFVLLGSAPDPRIQAEFDGLANSLGYAGGSVRFCFAFDEPLSHIIYAASDLVLVPSIFEPCGLTQLIAMRYGSIPVVRHTGGLRDTVFDVDFDKDRAAWEIEGSSDWMNDGVDATNGFAFSGTGTGDLDYALNRAMDAWYNDRSWFRELQKRVMEQDWSWNRPGLDYIELYHATLKSVSRTNPDCRLHEGSGSCLIRLNYEMSERADVYYAPEKEFYTDCTYHGPLQVSGSRVEQDDNYALEVDIESGDGEGSSVDKKRKSDMSLEERARVLAAPPGPNAPATVRPQYPPPIMYQPQQAPPDGVTGVRSRTHSTHQTSATPPLASFSRAPGETQSLSGIHNFTVDNVVMRQPTTPSRPPYDDLWSSAGSMMQLNEEEIIMRRAGALTDYFNIYAFVSYIMLTHRRIVIRQRSQFLGRNLFSVEASFLYENLRHVSIQRVTNFRTLWMGIGFLLLATTCFGLAAFNWVFALFGIFSIIISLFAIYWFCIFYNSNTLIIDFSKKELVGSWNIPGAEGAHISRWLILHINHCFDIMYALYDHQRTVFSANNA